jgi:DNA invertase Pin-like site-specific DNA recombinase
MIYGYVRDSADGQSVAAQVQQLTAAGCYRIFCDTALGPSDRTQLRRALRHLEAGDVLMVTRLDRLARSSRDLLNTLRAIMDRQAGFRSLKEVWADSTASHGRLMMTVLEGLAAFEHEMVRALATEGRARAKVRGQSLGRPHKLTVNQQQEVLRRREAGEAVREIARSYSVSASTISRLMPRAPTVDPVPLRPIRAI